MRILWGASIVEYAEDYATLQEVYDLMQRGGFPFVPHDWPTAYAALKLARNYVIKEDGKVVVWVGYHTFTDKQCDLDICVAPEYRKEWLTKGLFKDIVSKPLLDYQLDVVSCKCNDDRFYRSLLRLGFAEGYSEAGECVFTHKEYARKFGHLNG